MSASRCRRRMSRGRVSARVAAAAQVGFAPCAAVVFAMSCATSASQPVAGSSSCASDCRSRSSSTSILREACSERQPASNTGSSSRTSAAPRATAATPSLKWRSCRSEWPVRFAHRPFCRTDFRSSRLAASVHTSTASAKGAQSQRNSPECRRRRNSAKRGTTPCRASSTSSVSQATSTGAGCPLRGGWKAGSWRAAMVSAPGAAPAAWARCSARRRRFAGRGERGRPARRRDRRR